MATSENAYWSCPRCDAVNDIAAPSCENCGGARMPSVPPSKHAATCACLGQDPGCPSCCETCGGIRTALRKPAEYRVAAHCARCGTHSAGTNTFHADGAPADAGVRLCPSCWIPALRRRMLTDPPSQDLVASCLETIRAYTTRYPTTRVGT